MSSTPYGVSVNKGSMSYDNYVNSRIVGPLSTNQTPFHMPYHSYGVLSGIRPTPPQFYPSQQPVDANMNTNARYHYLRAITSAKQQAINRKLVLLNNSSTSKFSHSTGKMYNVSNHTNYISPIPSSMRTYIAKSKAVGQSSYKVNLPNNAPISTKNYYPSGVRSTIKRARSGGCTAPKKKGAIENINLANGAVCCWGGIVRQNY
jgi:hypothetical protein